MSRVVLDFDIHVTLDPLDHGHDPVNWPDPNFGLTFLAEVKMAVTPLQHTTRQLEISTTWKHAFSTPYD